jgi:hypothetical protein
MPVVALILKPGGRLFAPKLVGLPVAATWKEKAVPIIAFVVDELLITGGL